MEPPSADPDAALVAAAKAGDFGAFEQLVMQYERRLLATAYRMVGRREDAEDVVQETLASVIEHLLEFRGEARFYTWVMRILMNHALKRLRKDRRWTTTGGSDDDADLPHPRFIAPWREGPLATAERHELQQLLATALEELDDKYRTVFVLRDIEERSTAETAVLLQISEANVKIRLLRARLQLRERLTQALGDESRRLEPHHPHA